MADSKAAGITGAEALIGTLADCGISVCFANPGTSEMHLVTALDREPRIRPILCLFEGVATGAADGFARMSGVPALTLLHLGPGYLNGGANIHNARRAHSPMVNLIGDHALGHRALDAPLASDIAGLAGPNSIWLNSVDDLAAAGTLAAEAVAASFGPSPGPVSLVMPADIAWTEGASKASAQVGKPRVLVSDNVITAAADAVRNSVLSALLVSGTAVSNEAGLVACARLQAAGVRVFTDTFVPRQLRGAGIFAPARLPYFAEMALDALEGVDVMVMAGTKPPVSFFAYPDTPGELTPKDARQVELGGAEIDSADALTRLADALDAQAVAPAAEAYASDKPLEGQKYNPHTIGGVIARHLPENAIISDDGVTASLPIFLQTTGAARHDWLALMGGAIGQGLPVAVGAAVAEPERKVICLTGDGAGMYTIQSLWTMAREKLDVVTIVFVNHAYRILNIELARTGAGEPGEGARSMLSLGGPEIDWVSLSSAQGVPAEAASTLMEFDAVLARALAVKGPRLIAVMLEG